MIFLTIVIDGDILGKKWINPADKPKAEFTIKIFALNNASLIRARRNIGKSLIYLIDDNSKDDNSKLEDILSDISSYPNFIKAIYPKLKQKGLTP